MGRALSAIAVKLTVERKIDEMVDLELDDEVLKRLEALAQREHRTPSDVLRQLLDRYDPPQSQGEPWPLMMARMAEDEAERVEWTDGAASISQRSREILDNEYADALRRRIDRPEDA